MLLIGGLDLPPSRLATLARRPPIALELCNTKARGLLLPRAHLFLHIENRDSDRKSELRSLSKPGASSDVPGMAFRSISTKNTPFGFVLVELRRI